MSTRCLIGFEYKHNVKYIYCHFDGYPLGVGQMLYKYYGTPELAEKLCGLPYGIECLEKTVEESSKVHYDEGSGEMSYNEYHCTDAYGVDYVYCFRCWDSEGKRVGYWDLRPCYGYCMTWIAEENKWDMY